MPALAARLELPQGIELHTSTRAGAGDFSRIEILRRLLARPCDERPEFAAYAGFPSDWADTLSVRCSS
jgi:uncharacterized protein YdiU (UPF0061 family)